MASAYKNGGIVARYSKTKNIGDGVIEKRRVEYAICQNGVVLKKITTWLSPTEYDKIRRCSSGWKRRGKVTGATIDIAMSQFTSKLGDAGYIREAKK